MSNPRQARSSERLLKAWRGEVEAAAVYELIAQRMDDRRAEILRRMAEAEAGHRRRLEARMSELGVPIPDAPPSGCRYGCASRRGSRRVDRLLAAREAAEDDEVSDLYGRSTGDDATDQLLREIRATNARIRAPLRRCALEEASASPPRSPRRAVQARLDRILGRENWHQRGGSWISGAIYGANDGLAAVFGIVTGVSGATGGSSFVLTAGLAGAVASALSMATGAFLAERSEAEVMAANVERERQEIAEHPEEEKEELSLFYQLKGLIRRPRTSSPRTRPGPRRDAEDTVTGDVAQLVVGRPGDDPGGGHSRRRHLRGRARVSGRTPCASFGCLVTEGLPQRSRARNRLRSV